MVGRLKWDSRHELQPFWETRPISDRAVKTGIIWERNLELRPLLRAYSEVKMLLKKPGSRNVFLSSAYIKVA